MTSLINFVEDYLLRNLLELISFFNRTFELLLLKLFKIKLPLVKENFWVLLAEFKFLYLLDSLSFDYFN